MAEITRRRTGEFLRELFSILMAAPEGMRASDALQALAGRFTLTPFETSTYESGSRRFEKIVRFATVDCVKAGWLVKDKGIWTITDAGQAAHAELPDPEAFYKRACKLYAEWRAAQPDAEGSAAAVAAVVILPEASCKHDLQVRSEGGRQVRRLVKFYKLDAILVVGYRVGSQRGTQFRCGGTERLKNPLVGSSAVPDRFEELLARIRDIRASEHRMSLRLREIFAMAADYSPSPPKPRLPTPPSPASPSDDGFWPSRCGLRRCPDARPRP
jgi:Virulence protein RhuM family/Mrr N-terminal domain